MKALHVFLLLPLILLDQQDRFKFSFNHQSLPVMKLQEM